MRWLAGLIAGVALVVGVAFAGVAAADPSGTCPYEYCEYVAPRPPIPTGYPFYPAPWSIPSPTPKAHKPVVIVVNNAPLPPPTATHGPVHFPLYQPYDYACDCYPASASGIVEAPRALARVVSSNTLPQFKPPATGDGGVRKPPKTKTPTPTPTPTRTPQPFQGYTVHAAPVMTLAPAPQPQCNGCKGTKHVTVIIVEVWD